MVIGIGGVSRAGKTTLAYKIREWIGKEKVLILHQDQYIQPETRIPQLQNHIDWEHPGSLDFKKLIQLTKEKSQEYEHVIIEGLMVFYHQDLLQLMDKKIYISISKQVFLNRKTLDKRWGNEPSWYINHIWESHFIYGLLPDSEKDSLKIDGESISAEEKVLEFLNIHKSSEHD